MNIQGPHDFGSKDKIFAHVINGSASQTITRGDVCTWDATDNTAAAGIMANTFGLRVLQWPTTGLTNRAMGVAGVAEQTAVFDASAASTPGQSFLMQIYGFHDAVRVATGDITTLRGVVASNTAAGVIQAASAAAETAAELSAHVGFAFVTATAPATTGVFIRLM